MAQLKRDEWPTDREKTTTEAEVPATSQAAHDAALEQAQETMRDRLSQYPPVDRQDLLTDKQPHKRPA